MEAAAVACVGAVEDSEEAADLVAAASTVAVDSVEAEEDLAGAVDSAAVVAPAPAVDLAAEAFLEVASVQEAAPIFRTSVEAASRTAAVVLVAESAGASEAAGSAVAEPGSVPMSFTCRAKVAADCRLVRDRRSTRAAASRATSTSAIAPAASVPIFRDGPRASGTIDPKIFPA